MFWSNQGTGQPWMSQRSVVICMNLLMETWQQSMLIEVNICPITAGLNLPMGICITRPFTGLKIVDRRYWTCRKRLSKLVDGMRLSDTTAFFII